MDRGCVGFLLFWFLAGFVSCSDGSPADGGVDAAEADGAEGGAGDEWEPTDWIEESDSGAEPDGSPDDGSVEDGADAAEAADEGGEGDGPGDGDPATDDVAPAMFSVLTINLKHPLTGMDEALQRLQMVADGINDKQPDVVALQEVIRDGQEPSFAEQLAGLTGYEWIWEFTYSVPTLFDEGLGILSRWPIVWSDSAELPHLDLFIFRRRVLGGRVQSPHGEIQLFCTHMTTDSDETVEADQALAVYQFIQGNPSALAGFLAGDLNAEPQTLAMRFFRGEAQHQGVTGNLIDAWVTANPGEDGFTIQSNNPTRRIDYVYLVPGLQRSAEIDACELMFTEPVGGVYASDHLGVLCRFSLQP